MLWGLYTLPETNISPKDRWLEDHRFFFGMGSLPGRTVSFREGRYTLLVGLVPGSFDVSICILNRIISQKAFFFRFFLSCGG